MSHLRSIINQHKPPAWRGVVSTSWPILASIFVGLFFYTVLGPAMGGYASNLLLIIAINVLLATSLTVVNGFTGQFSIGHGAFMGVGAYVTGSIVYYASLIVFGDAQPHGGALSESLNIAYFKPLFEQTLITKGDLIFLASIVAAALGAAGAGYVVGLPSLRLKGDYLAIVTLGFGEIMRVLLQATPQQVSFRKPAEAAATPLYELLFKVGGAQGLKFVPTYTSLFWSFSLLTLCMIAMYRLKTSSSGRAFLSIREDEVAAQAMGVHVTKYKIRAFVLSSAFAGVAGALYAGQTGTLVPQDFGYQRSFEILIMVVLGGLGSLSGAAIAAAILTLLPEVLRDPAGIVGVWYWVLGAAVVLGGAGAALMVVARKQGRATHLPRWLIGGGAFLLAGLGVCALASWQNIDLGKYRLIFYALALIIMLILRPQGLLGVSEVWERGLWREAFGKLSNTRRGKAKTGGTSGDAKADAKGGGA
jgi:branched-chain amino acid transport system permease protein